MSERNDAARLNKEWDDLVQTPRSARTGKSGAEDTIGQLHAMDVPESPDPAFRTQLRQQLLRESAYRTGQDRAAVLPPIASEHGPAPSPNQISRALEVIAVAVIVVIVGTALIWAVDLRGDRDQDVTPTFDLAATSTNLIVASPESTAPPTSTPLPSPTVTPEPSSTAEPTETTVPQPTVTTEPTTDPQPGETAVIVVPSTEAADECGDIAERLTTVTSSLAATELPSEARGTIPATSRQVDAVNEEFDAFVTCLKAISPDELRTLVIDTYVTPETSTLDRARIAQELSGFASQTYTLTDVAILPGSQASASITLEDGSVYIGVFSLQNAGWTATIVQIYPDTQGSSAETPGELTSAPSVTTTTSNSPQTTDEPPVSGGNSTGDGGGSSGGGGEDDDGDVSEDEEGGDDD